MANRNGSTWISVKVSQHGCTSEELCPDVSSTSSALSTQLLEEQEKRLGDYIHTNVYKPPPLGRGYVDTIVPSVKAKLRTLVQCCLEFLTMEVSVIWGGLVWKRLVRCQNPDVRNPMII